MKTRLTFLNTRAKCEAGQKAHTTVLKLGMGFGAEALLQQLIDKVDLLKLSNQDLLQSNADLTSRVEALEDNDAFPIKVGMVVMVNQAVTDMSDYMGYGTWTRVCLGRSPLGSGFTTDARGESILFMVGATGGAYKHVQTVAQMPPHKHNQNSSNFHNWIGNRNGINRHDIPNTNGTGRETGETGGGEPFNITHPYQVFEIWQRTA